MANRRSKVIDALVNPAALPALSMLADTITLSDTKVLTITFPAKTVVAVVATSVEGNTDASVPVWASSISSNLATVTFTKTGTGKFSYIIIYSPTETIDAQTATDDLSQEPVQ